MNIIVGCLVFAGCGIAANTVFIASSLRGAYRASSVYSDLSRNPSAFGREIAPQVIESLRRPIGLWAAFATLILAAGFGLLLALELLVSGISLSRDPTDSFARLRRYVRWKPVGAGLTAMAAFWTGTADWQYWCAATRHIPLGSGPPYFSTLLLWLCALVPVWWLRHHLERFAV